MFLLSGFQTRQETCQIRFKPREGSPLQKFTHWKINPKDHRCQSKCSVEIEYGRHPCGGRFPVQGHQVATHCTGSAMCSRPKRSVRGTSSHEDTVAYISAEIEFFAELKERMDQGESTTVTEVAALYSNMMHDHGIQNNSIMCLKAHMLLDSHCTCITTSEVRKRYHC